jgi:hypothetical protein
MAVRLSTCSAGRALLSRNIICLRLVLIYVIAGVKHQCLVRLEGLSKLQQKIHLPSRVSNP